MRNRRRAGGGDGRRHAATGARDGNHAHAGDGLGRGDAPRDACRASGVACAMVCRAHAVACRRRQDGSGTTIESRHHTRIRVLIARVLLGSHTFAPYSHAEISSEVV